MEEKQKNSNKIILIVLSVGIVVFIALILVLAFSYNGQDDTLEYPNVSYSHTMENGTKVNVSQQMNVSKTLDGLTITITSITEKDNYTKILGEIVNNTEQALGGYEIECVLLAKDGKEITKVGGYLPTVEPGNTGELNCSVIGAYTDAYDIKILKKNQ